MPDQTQKYSICDTLPMSQSEQNNDLKSKVPPRLAIGTVKFTVLGLLQNYGSSNCTETYLCYEHCFTSANCASMSV